MARNKKKKVEKKVEEVVSTVEETEQEVVEVSEEIVEVTDVGIRNKSKKEVMMIMKKLSQQAKEKAKEK